MVFIEGRLDKPNNKEDRRFRRPVDLPATLDELSPIFAIVKPALTEGEVTNILGSITRLVSYTSRKSKLPSYFEKLVDPFQGPDSASTHISRLERRKNWWPGRHGIMLVVQFDEQDPNHGIQLTRVLRARKIPDSPQRVEGRYHHRLGR